MKTKEYLNIDYKFNPSVYEALISSNELCGIKARSIKKFPYIKVYEWKQKMIEGRVLNVMSEILNISINTILETKHTDFVYFSKWLENEFIEILKLENDLIVEPTDEMIEAGVERMAKFNIVNILDGLSNGDPTKWDEIANLPYEKVHVKLLKNKTEGQILENYREIQKRKNKKE